MYAMGWTIRVIREGLRRLASIEGLDASPLEDGDIWRWLRGEVFPRDSLDRLCRLFQCHQTQIGWPPRGNETPIDYTRSAMNAADRQQSNDGAPDQADANVANARSSAAVPEPLPASDWPVPQVKISGPSPDSSHSSVMQGFRETDKQFGGGHLYPIVVQYLQATVAPHLFGAVVGADARTVFTAAGALTEMAGWMAYDAGQPRLARQHFNRALDLAKIGGDRELYAHILASTSHLASHMHRPDEAIRLARAGQNTLPARSRPPELEARLLAMGARGFAALGDATETKQILSRAETTLHRAHSAEPSQWISRFDDGSLATEAARCMQRLEQFAEAERFARRVIALRSADRKRSRAFGQLILVSVLVAQGRCDEGCAIANEVLDATQSLESVLVLDQLRDLQEVLAPYRSGQMVAEFLGRLADILPERRRHYPWIAATEDRLNNSGAQV
jgi:tetratricopeptide (TPR) repeat protein